jgi:hypothetical protein
MKRRSLIPPPSSSSWWTCQKKKKKKAQKKIKIPTKMTQFDAPPNMLKKLAPNKRIHQINLGRKIRNAKQKLTL